MAQFDAARNMTDVLAALMVLADLDRPERDMALARFYGLWSHDELVIDKWFALQARSSLPATPDRVRELTRHPAFERQEPKRVRALVGTFAQANHCAFTMQAAPAMPFSPTRSSPSSPINPRPRRASSKPLGSWHRHDPAHQTLMRRELERVLATPELSKNTYEMVSKSLA